jgi:hypothetical protein
MPVASVLLPQTVEKYLDDDPKQVDLIFTSPPFIEPDPTDSRFLAGDWLWDTFYDLAGLVKPGGSLVVVHGNSWKPPHASLATWANFAEIDSAVGRSLSLAQTLVVEFAEPRMSPSVAEGMVDVPRFDDRHGHAWWWVNGQSRKLPHATSIVRAVHSPIDREFEARLPEWGLEPYHATLPISVPSFFIRALTNPYDTVLDPFAGTNSTGAAAELLGRESISLEPDPEQLRRAELRP